MYCVPVRVERKGYRVKLESETKVDRCPRWYRTIGDSEYSSNAGQVLVVQYAIV
jgi:hypothetical protein